MRASIRGASPRGWRDNHKRVHRLYKADGLSLRHCRPRRSRSGCRRQPRKEAFAVNDLWGMDFVSDALFDGRRFRTLTIVDHFTHECLGIVVDQSLRGEHVAEAMTRLVVERGLPTAIQGRQRKRVCRQGDGPVGLRKWRRTRPLSPRHADGQRPSRELQRAVPAGVPQRALILVTGRRQVQDRRVAALL